MISRQQSFVETNTGLLYLIPTPIGNLEDITFRALRLLKEVDVIAAEDTRQTRKLLAHFDISTPLVSYHEHNKKKSGEKLIERLKKGEHVGLVSDAGMPVISDPGYELVVRAIEEQIHVIPIPGANAALPALIASGLPTDHFYFYGFLHRHKKEKKQELQKLKSFSDTVILYESPHRLKETLKAIYEVLGNRRMVISRELTKKFEEFIRGRVKKVLEYVEKEPIKGECCLVIEGSLDDEDVKEQWWENLTVTEHVEHYITIQKYHSKEAIKQVAKDRGVSKREVYHEYHIKEN